MNRPVPLDSIPINMQSNNMSLWRLPTDRQEAVAFRVIVISMRSRTPPLLAASPKLYRHQSSPRHSLSVIPNSPLCDKMLSGSRSPYLPRSVPWHGT